MNRIVKYLIVGVPVALIGSAFVKNLPELRRYLRMKEM
jgi:sulfite exporter TauE/SafE